MNRTVARTVANDGSTYRVARTFLGGASWYAVEVRYAGERSYHRVSQWMLTEDEAREAMLNNNVPWANKRHAAEVAKAERAAARRAKRAGGAA